MKLPAGVRSCLDRLEQAGYATYAVGGCVRDWCMGLEPHDFDLCTAALPEEMQAVFAGERLVLAGVKHGTVGVVTGEEVVEITTFRTEGDYNDARHPGWVRFVPELEQDLARRDFTINAMAWSPDHGFRDPFGGRQDLENRILRAVGDPERRFREDALRILRGARFAARFRLQVEENTRQAMVALAPALDKLARERVLEELCKLLLAATAADLLTFGPVLAAAVPELALQMGFQQHSPHHAYDVFTHTAHVVEAVPREPVLRWAALLHDVGKPGCFTLDENGRGHFKGHAPAGAAMAEEILRRLKAPTALREDVVLLIGQHMTPLEPDKKLLRRRLSKLGPERLGWLLQLQQADMGSKGTGKTEEMERFPQIQAILQEILEEKTCLTLKDLAVDGHDLMALGLTGRYIGVTLNRLLELVLEERVPNEREALLAAAMSF